MKYVKCFYCCILCAIIICPYSISAQTYSISADSLLNKIISDGSVFKTFECSDFFTHIDIKDCYYNDTLKEQMLKLLDEEAYRVYDNTQFISSWLADEESKNNEIKKWLEKHMHQMNVDSTMNIATLYSVYEDSVIMELTNEVSKHRKPALKMEYEMILSLIKWPEVYEEYHRQWVNDGSRVGGNKFFAMLCMHDPEAISKSNKQCEEWYKSNDFYKIHQTIYETPNCFYLGSYAITLALKSLSCTSPIVLFDYGEDDKLFVPFNVRQLQYWESMIGDSFFEKQYEHNKLNLIKEKLTNPNIMICETWPELCDKLAKEPLAISKNELCLFTPKECLMKLGEEIREAVDIFMIEFDSYIYELALNEKYWKQNMPYYQKTENGE